MSVTIKDIAERAQVSKTVVSLYLNHRPLAEKFATATKARIDAAVRELGYRPNYAARALARGKTRTIGMVTTSILDPFFHNMVDLVMRELAHAGYRLVLTIPQEGIDSPDTCFEQLLTQQVDGLLCCVQWPLTGKINEELQKKRAPLVLLNCSLPGFSASFADPSQALEEAVRFLAGRGQRKITVITQHCYRKRNLIFEVCRKLRMEAELFADIGTEESLEACCCKLAEQRPACLQITNCRIVKTILRFLDRTAPDYSPEIVTSRAVPVDDVSDPRIVGTVVAPFRAMVIDGVRCLLRQVEEGVPEQSELDAVLLAYVEAIVKNPNRKLTTAWLNGYDGIISAYLGEYPETFEYNGQTYTPESFRDYLGINTADYVNLTSFTHHPFYTQFPIEVRDNWRWDNAYNLPIDEFMEVMYNAIDKGFTIAWGSDVSEQGFTGNGIATVPDVDIRPGAGSDQERWVGKEESDEKPEGTSGEEKQITQEMRQVEFDNKLTTDDHGMHIFGLAQDQNGNRFFMVKNSWGDAGKYQGIWYASDAFVRYKTLNIVVHKDALPKDIKKKLGIK